MSTYEKQGFVSGQILTAEQLNYIEEGIAKILPYIEHGTARQLVTDTDGNLLWEDKEYGYTIEDQLLYPETELTGESQGMTPLLKPEVDDVVTAYVGDKVFTGTIRLLPDGTLMAPVTDGTNYLVFSHIEPGLETSIRNQSSLTGTLKVMVKTKKIR